MISHGVWRILVIYVLTWFFSMSGQTESINIFKPLIMYSRRINLGFHDISQRLRLLFQFPITRTSKHNITVPTYIYYVHYSSSKMATPIIFYSNETEHASLLVHSLFIAALWRKETALNEILRRGRIFIDPQWILSIPVPSRTFFLFGKFSRQFSMLYECACTIQQIDDSKKLFHRLETVFSFIVSSLTHSSQGSDSYIAIIV